MRAANGLEVVEVCQTPERSPRNGKDVTPILEPLFSGYVIPDEQGHVLVSWESDNGNNVVTQGRQFNYGHTHHVDGKQYLRLAQSWSNIRFNRIPGYPVSDRLG